MGPVWPQILGKTADSRAESHAEIPSGAARHEDATGLRCLVREPIRVSVPFRLAHVFRPARAGSDGPLLGLPIDHASWAHHRNHLYRCR